MTRFFTFLAVLGLVSTLGAQGSVPPATQAVAKSDQIPTTVTASPDAQKLLVPQPTHEDELTLQIVILKSQLAQAIAANAKCEANGPQSAQLAQDANAAAQTFLASLDARGLKIDEKTNKIIAKPPEPAKPVPPVPKEP